LIIQRENLKYNKILQHFYKIFILVAMGLNIIFYYFILNSSKLIPQIYCKNIIIFCCICEKKKKTIIQLGTLVVG